MHVMEPATTGRARCRACGRKIERGEIRFGERRDNAFGEGEATLWFHPLCAAYSRPEPLLELLSTQGAAGTDDLCAVARVSMAHPRLQRLQGAALSPTGKAHCRQCHAAIDKGTWRVALGFFEEFRFNAAGFIHAACAADYFGTADIMERVKHFSPELGSAQLHDLEKALASSAAGSP